jgi:hypothetical protein
MLFRPLILVAALAAAVPAFAQDSQAERDRLAAIRAQGEAERAALEVQRLQMEQQNRQRELEARLDAIEAQRRTDEILRQPASATTTLTTAEQQRQFDLEARLAAVERQRNVDQLAAARSPSQAQPTPAAALPRISPFETRQPNYGTATEAQKQAAAEAYAACLIQNAKRLDDHVSDAATIALAIQPGCAIQFESWRGVLQQGVPSSVRVAVDQALEAGQQGGAVQAVLQARQQSRAAR